MANEHADFSPTLQGYSGQRELNFWCQKVLPLVYDDALSYYEVLDKVVEYINGLLTDVSELEDRVTALEGENNGNG